ncbi:MAG: leucine-rich repeat domain-containing protein, partial [Prevotella sp.]|nr:leucine-rich repeat domain-containing protein [Prevotella sp.]
IPNSVRSIDYRAFYGTAWYDNQPDGLVYAGKVAYAYKGTMPENTSIDIEEGTKSITALAFAGCNGLKSITIPLGIASIEQGTFMGCRSLTSISIPNSVTSIDNQAFLWCESLTNITIPNNVMTMGNSVFSNCTSLTSIYVPFDKLAEWANGPLSDNKAQLAVKLTANAAGPANYSTYYYGATTSLKPNLVADENTTVYKAKQKDASTLTLTTIDDRIIPDATAVVLKTTDDEIVLRYTETAATGDFTDNILEGSNTYKEVDPDTYYVLGQNAGNIGFYVFTGHVLAAGKAYIPVSSVSGMAARGLTLEEDGETTGIDNFAPTLPQGEEAVYDLQGRRVEHPVKGIYIVNGRKVVIR